MGIKGDYKIKLVDGKYKVEISSGYSTADSSPTLSSSSDDEPSGYTHKSVETTTKTCGKKTTKTTTTTYKFKDGSSQTFTETVTSSC